MSDLEEKEKVLCGSGLRPTEEVGQPFGELNDINGGVENKIEGGKIVPAVDEEVDLDVIDCYTDDFDSDMEGDFCRKETKRLADNAKQTPDGESVKSKGLEVQASGDENVSLKEVKVASKVLDDNKPEIDLKDERNVLESGSRCDNIKSYSTSADKNKMTILKTPASGEEYDDEDIIQIDHIDILPEEILPEMSHNNDDELKRKRILSGPLIKQIVVPELDTSDDGGKIDVESHESLGLQIDHTTVASKVLDECNLEEHSEVIQENNENDAEQGAIGGCQQEDPEVLQLKLDLYQDIGAMDYEAHHEAHSDTSKGQKTDEEEDKIRGSLDTMFIKEEPVSPVKEHPETNQDEEDIPTIDLTSSDEETESPTLTLSRNIGNKVEEESDQPSVKVIDVKDTASKSEDSQEMKVASGDEISCVESTESGKRENSDACSSASMDDVFYDTSYRDRVLSLRKREVTILPEVALPASVKKIRTRRLSIDDQIWNKKSAKKKKEDPLMRGYKRRRSATKSASKCSLVSSSTAASSTHDEETLHMDTTGELPVISVTILDSNEIQIDSIEKDGALASLQLDDETVETGSQNRIVEEPVVKVPMADDEFEVQTVQNSVIPESSTEIELDDVLQSFLNKEEKLKQLNAVQFHSISSDEKTLMDSLFADCEKQAQQIPDISNLEIIFDDGKPLVEQNKTLSECDPLGIYYTVQESENNPGIISLQYSDQCKSTLPNISPHSASKVKGPLINIIQNYQKYPFQPKVVKKKPEKPLKEIRQLPHTKARRKRPDSDEEYRPRSYMRSRRIAMRTHKKKISVPTTHFIPTGAYLATDSETMKSTEEGNEAKAVCKDMPTLEDDLALTSSDSSSSIPLANICASNGGGTSAKISLFDQDKKNEAREKEIEACSTSAGPTKPTPSVAPTAQPTTTIRKRGRPPKNPDRGIFSFFCSPPERNNKQHCDVSRSERESKKTSKTQSIHTTKKDVEKATDKRKRRRIFSTSEEESLSINIDSSSEEELVSLATPVVSDVKSNNELIQNDYDQDPESDSTADIQMNNVQVIISPLTDDKIRRINTPKKAKKAMSKASQTEICGLTWSIHLEQIDFCSEYFEKLRVLLNRGASGVEAARKPSGKESPKMADAIPQKFEGIEMPSRAALHLSLSSSFQMVSPIDSPSLPSEKHVGTGGVNNCRTQAEEFLFQRGIDEVATTTKYVDDQCARNRMEQATKTLRTTFRIPKISKGMSVSPQAVTSSTSNASVSNIKDDEQNSARPSSSSRCNDLIPQNITRCVETVNEGQQQMDSYGSGRPSINEYIDDGNEFLNSTVPNNPPIIASSINFASAVNLNFPAVMKKRIEQPGPDHNGNAQTPMSLSLGGSLSGLPDRSEMIKVKRTIKNDISESQPLVQNHQPLLLNPPLFSGFPPFGAGNVYSNNINRQYPTYSDMSMKSLAYSGGMGMFGTTNINFAGNSNGVNEFLTVLCEQFKQQQQQLQYQAFNQPSTMAMHPLISQPGTAQPLAFGQMFPQIKQTTTPTETSRSSEEMEMICHLFGCYDFLSNKCVKLQCRYSHILPKEEEVYQKLLSQTREFIMTTYRFVASRDDLFVKYFPTYARVMGRSNMRHQLVATIPDCEQSKRPLQYYRLIAEGLKMSGTSPVQAVQIILEKHTKKNFHQITVLIELILETGDGIPTFLRWLEEFLNVKGYHYDIPSINRLLEHFIISERPSKEMAKFLSQLVLKVMAGEESVINVRTLLEFVKKVGQDPDMTLDVEAIVQKYANVVMVA